MRTDSVPALPERLGLPGRRDAWLVGAGGKTSLLYALAHALVRAGASALTTTSTHIRPPERGQSPCLVLGAEPARLVADVRRARAAHAHVTVAARALAAEGKLQGLGLPALARLIRAGLAAHVLVEADGAAGRPLKAHAAHEPVVAPDAALVIVVVGAAAVGAPLDEAHVHRVVLAAARLGLPPGTPLAAADVARLVLHPDDALARVSPASEVAACVVDTAAGALAGAAAELAAALRATDRAGRLARVVACVLPPGGADATA